MNNWFTLINAEMAHNDDSWSRVEQNTMTDDEMDVMFDTTVWLAMVKELECNRVLFPGVSADCPIWVSHTSMMVHTR